MNDTCEQLLSFVKLIARLDMSHEHCDDPENAIGTLDYLIGGARQLVNNERAA